MYIVEKTKNFNIFKNFDYILFIAVIALSIIGCFVARSAVNTFPSSRKMMIVHIGCLVVGAMMAVAISFLDYKNFKIPGILFYLFTIALLVLVLFKGTGEEWEAETGLCLWDLRFSLRSWRRYPLLLSALFFLREFIMGKRKKRLT